MLRVTSITEQKKNAKRREGQKDKRFNVFLDGKYAFSIGEELLLKTKLKEDQVLSEGEINSIKVKENETKFLDRAINFLSYRPRSEKEVRDYLIKTISKVENIKWSNAKESSLPDLVIQKLKKYKYINDLDFAKWWTESRRRSRPKGRRLIALELKRKGVEEKVIEKLLPKTQRTDINLALQVLEKKKNKLLKLQSQEVKKKVFYYLGSRGFDFDTIKEAFAIFTKKD